MNYYDETIELMQKNSIKVRMMTTPQRDLIFDAFLRILDWLSSDSNSAFDNYVRDQYHFIEKILTKFSEE